MDIRTKEAIRYLGYGNHAVDDSVLALIRESFDKLDEAVSPRFIYRIFDMLHDDCIQIGNLKIDSKHLSKNLKGCKEVIILAATLGVGVDLLIKRTSLTDMAKAVVLQACAAVMLEEYIDEQQENLGYLLEKEGKYLRPRFSPGYGDFNILHQDQILRMLDSAKKIGLTMTESYMLTPTKSVTAIIGVSNTKEPCHRHGCEMCTHKECIFRRNT